MRVLHLVSGLLMAMAALFIGVLTTSLPLEAVLFVSIVLGIGVAAGLWALEGTVRPPVGWDWYLWGAGVLASLVAALWAEATANEGCSGTLNDTRRLLATLALVALGAGAFWLPARGMGLLLGRNGFRRHAAFLGVGALWVVIWGFLWLVVWRVMFGCVD